MKRFVVIVTSLLIIFVFIALNYLLWDRESLVTLRESNQASIDALSRINMNLSEENSSLEKQANEMKGQIESLEEKVKELKENSSEQKLIIEEQTQFILELKAKIDPEPAKIETVDWVNSLSQKLYDKAFLKCDSATTCSFWGNYWTPRMFSTYFVQNVEDIQLLLQEEEQKPMIEVKPYQTPDWKVKALVHVQVILKEEAVEEYLQQGENIIELDFTYSDRLEQWVINSIYSTPVETKEVEEPILNKDDELDEND